MLWKPSDPHGLLFSPSGETVDHYHGADHVNCKITVSYSYAYHYVYVFSDVLLMKQKDEQNIGGSFNAHKHWKKLREKHRKRDAHIARGGNTYNIPETYTPDLQHSEGSTRDISKELYNLNYELAFGRITEEEYKKRKSNLDLG